MEGMSPQDERLLDVMFRDARTLRRWQDRPVDPALLQRAWDLAKWGPTSANCMPLRVVFVISQEAKARLQPALIPGNVEQTMKAPVTAIMAHDSRFYDLLPRLYPHTDARSWFTGPENATAADETAFRNGSLQAAYYMLGLRAVGLDCGPMSGFDRVKVDAEFFPDGRLRSNFLCNVGYGDRTRLKPRGPRLAFDEIAAIA